MDLQILCMPNLNGVLFLPKACSFMVLYQSTRKFMYVANYILRPPVICLLLSMFHVGKYTYLLVCVVVSWYVHVE